MAHVACCDEACCVRVCVCGRSVAPVSRWWLHSTHHLLSCGWLHLSLGMWTRLKLITGSVHISDETEAVVSRQISRHCVDALSQVQLRIVIGSVHPITPSVTDWMWFIPPPGLVVVMFSLSVCMSVCQHGKVKSCGQILTKIFGGMWYVTSNSWLNYSYDLVHSADDDF